MSFFSHRIKINRNEIAGAFGDIGTDLPLIVGMLMATQLETANVLVVYGLLQIMTVFLYGIPMPVQPLKAVAMIVITQKVSASVIWGGGLAIAIIVALCANGLPHGYLIGMIIGILLYYFSGNLFLKHFGKH